MIGPLDGDAERIELAALRDEPIAREDVLSLCAQLREQDEFVDELSREKGKLEDEIGKLEYERDELLDKRGEPSDSDELAQLRKDALDRARIIASLQERLHAAESRLAATSLVVDDYSDMLALARRFVSTAEKAGIRTRHVREATKPRPQKTL